MNHGFFMGRFDINRPMLPRQIQKVTGSEIGESDFDEIKCQKKVVLLKLTIISILSRDRWGFGGTAKKK